MTSASDPNYGDDEVLELDVLPIRLTGRNGTAVSQRVVVEAKRIPTGPWTGRPHRDRGRRHSVTEGYVVLVPNVFYRHGRAPLIADLPDLLKPENRERMLEAIRPLGAGLTVQASMGDADAYLDFLAGYESVARGPVGITGYCMGGALAVRTAGTFPDRVAAAASFHGGNLATEAPDSPHLLADRIQAELYFGHADQDRSMPADQIARLEEALDRAGVRYQSEVYEGAAHGYTMSDTAAYSPAGADRHWTALFALLGRTFQATR